MDGILTGHHFNPVFSVFPPLSSPSLVISHSYVTAVSLFSLHRWGHKINLRGCKINKLKKEKHFLNVFLFQLSFPFLQKYAYLCVACYKDMHIFVDFFFSSCKLIIHFSSIGLSQNDSNNVFGLAFKRSKANKCWELLVSCVGHSVPLFINTIYVPPLFPHAWWPLDRHQLLKFDASGST